MPLSALPDHLDSQEEIDAAFPDDSQFGTMSLFGKLYRAFNKKTKTWFCFSYRCSQSWARWRKTPVVLFAIGGRGPWRWESFHGMDAIDYNRKLTDVSLQKIGYYISRIQYYKRWSFVIQWPLTITFHWYPRAKHVPKWGLPRPELDGKLWFGYWNHFDGDYVYWMVTSIYLGRNWK